MRLTAMAFAALAAGAAAALPPHPDPCLSRGAWTSLDGMWDYAVTAAADDLEVLAGARPGPKHFAGRIRVPFAIESKASGVGRLLEPNERLWQSRHFAADVRPGLRTVLHFGGVDWRAQVFVNGVEACLPHEGMNEAFAVDVTDLVRAGSNRLDVVSWDPTVRGIGACGAQALRPALTTRTRTSGIWQPVWLETVPDDWIAGCSVAADPADGSVRVRIERPHPSSAAFRAEAWFGTNLVAAADAASPTEVRLSVSRPLRLWSPEEPNLYRLVLTLGEDRVESFFAFRTVSLAKDPNGVRRFALNGRSVYFYGVAYEARWPETLLTAPSADALERDLRFAKAAGFNLVRLKGKVESPAFYAACDRLGLMVAQDVPGGGGDADLRYGAYRRELKGIVDRLRAHPSVVMWIPYVEGHGQPGAKLTHDTLAWLRRYDPTRLVDGPAGWNDYEGGLSHRGFHVEDWGVVPANHRRFDADAVDMHVTSGVGMFRANANRASFLGEYGLIGDDVDVGFGYGELSAALAELARRGLAGSVYRSLADADASANDGLLDCARRPRVSADRLQTIHAELARAVADSFAPRRNLTLVPRLATRANAWAWTDVMPSHGWKTPGFNDSGWGRSAGGFGDNYVLARIPSAAHAIEWTSDDLWLRTEFEWKGGRALDAYVEMFHTGEVDVHINGQSVLEVSGRTAKWETYVIDRVAFEDAVREGRNVLAVHARRSPNGQYFDLGLFADLGERQ